MKKTVYILLNILMIAVILVPAFFILRPAYDWSQLQASELNVWIIDKTVPRPDYREHKALTWVLDYRKIVNEKTGEYFDSAKDYYGYFPLEKNTFEIREIPDTVETPDMIYLTDTYGVYQDDLTTSEAYDSENRNIYGGLDESEIRIIEKNLGGGNTIVGEFNIASSPTNEENKKILESIFSLEWSGWRGRQFDDLRKYVEIPDAIVEQYESQEGREWSFSGQGYVFISDEGQIIVLEKEKHYEKSGYSIKFREEFREKYSIKNDSTFKMWFEVINPEPGTEILADYEADLTEDGIKLLSENGIPISFPAAVHKVNRQYQSYYFAGDFADMQSGSEFYRYYNLHRIKQFMSKYYRDKPEYFYWNCYVPLMSEIIEDVSARAASGEIPSEEGLPYPSKVEGSEFLVNVDGSWEKKFIKGVNLGAGKPGAFPGELAITKGEYLRWLKYISEMGANTIRVYTTLTPDFYDALNLFNKTSDNPIYLLQGVWVREEDIDHLLDAYAQDSKIMNDFIKDGRDLVDVLHGNITLPEKPGFASGKYTSDVSEYTIGWILGIEWYPDFVEGTNTNNPEKSSYSGKYLHTEDASPFEAFLCEVGDSLIAYETEKYDAQRPVSYSNWPTTDMLEHSNEPSLDEDRAVVNIEHIKATDSFEPGVFASYHIYPYYPDFMNYQREYAEFRDETGKINSYRAYLRDLMSQHTMPVLVAEFGVPASRGMAHENITMGYHQGNHDESEQGRILAEMLSDIYSEGYMGGLVFTWQDEWFKRTWNTMDFDDPDSRPYWSNPQTNEQQFGIMAFDPGEEKSVSYVDGDFSEWEDESPVAETDDIKLYSKSDEKYLYIMTDAPDFDFSSDRLIIPIDTIEGQGNDRPLDYDMTFSNQADFVIEINGKEESRIKVDAYYDSFYYFYGYRLKMIPQNPLFTQRNTGLFNNMNLALNKELYLPQDRKVLPFSSYETGLLRFGNANPESSDFNSMSDFIYKDGKLEIRIPWQLLNVMNPARREIMADLYKHGIKKIPSGEMSIGAAVEGSASSEGSPARVEMKPFTWETWDMPTYHERLKPSYYILKDAFSKYE